MPNTASILAGPILRRSTVNRVCVWLALDKAVDLTLEILDGATPAVPQTPGEQRMGISKPEQISSSRYQLGSNLFVYLLQAYPVVDAGVFPLGRTLYYRILDAEGQPAFDLSGVVYPGQPYPRFHIPGELKNVLHGSCRKPHGYQGEDCFALGDTLVAEASRQNALGPDLLLLTGDQIYADDVDATLLALLRGESQTLVGYQETMPGVTTRDKTRIQPDSLKLGGRADIMEKAGFSSEAASNHLMSFGEFSAMYLYILGNAPNWALPGWDAVKPGHVPVEADDEQALIASAKATAEFSHSLSSVRRMLANIPVYMIFDDHDVSDDWNITGDWYDKVRASPLGRRVVSNALAAYWAFQGWGNDPENFDADMINAIVGWVNQATPTPQADELYDLTTWKHRGWSFSVPTHPPVIAMDSRTQRQPDNPYFPPRLLDRYALDWLSLEWFKLANRQEAGQAVCPVLIATTPVLGFAPVENLIQLALWLTAVIEDYPAVKWTEEFFGINGVLTEALVNKADAEAWTSNLDGLTGLLDTLLHKMQLSQCLFLSGDVHYAFSTTGFYTSKDGNGFLRRLGCCQLTSSSLRNEPQGMQEKALEFFGKLDNAKSVKTNWWRVLGSRWRLEHQLIAAQNGKRVEDIPNLGQVSFANGLPVEHKLWLKQDDSREFKIPDF